MEQIASFTVNHMRLLPGIYVSRKDSTGQDVVTTYDICNQYRCGNQYKR